jgi:hypothetical protein
MRKNDPNARAEITLPYRLDRSFNSRQLTLAIKSGYRVFAPPSALRAAQYFFIRNPTAFR